jgi:soluble lytic murein transglycosylase-like protein
MLAIWINDNRESLQAVNADIRDLKDTLEKEIELRKDFFSKLKKSASLLNKYNPGLDYFTALKYACKIYECSDQDLSVRVLTALIVVESNADFRAVSKRGALGLTQVMPGIWKCDRKVLTDPYKNIEIGSSILKNYINRHGLIGGLSAYNSGKKNNSLGYAEKVVTIANEHF